MIRKSQAWYFTRLWQEGEKEADEDIINDRIYSFPDAQSAIAFLHDKVHENFGKDNGSYVTPNQIPS